MKSQDDRGENSVAVRRLSACFAAPCGSTIWNGWAALLVSIPVSTSKVITWITRLCIQSRMLWSLLQSAHTSESGG